MDITWVMAPISAVTSYFISKALFKLAYHFFKGELPGPILVLIVLSSVGLSLLISLIALFTVFR